MMIAFCPAGPTSNMSISSGKVWVRPLMVTVTLVTVPWPATTMSDGYGVAVPLVPLAGFTNAVEMVKPTAVQLVLVVGVAVPLACAMAVSVLLVLAVMVVALVSLSV